MPQGGSTRARSRGRRAARARGGDRHRAAPRRDGSPLPERLHLRPARRRFAARCGGGKWSGQRQDWYPGALPRRRTRTSTSPRQHPEFAPGNGPSRAELPDADRAVQAELYRAIVLAGVRASGFSLPIAALERRPWRGLTSHRSGVRSSSCADDADARPGRRPGRRSTAARAISPGWRRIARDCSPTPSPRCPASFACSSRRRSRRSTPTGKPYRGRARPQPAPEGPARRAGAAALHRPYGHGVRRRSSVPGDCTGSRTACSAAPASPT